MHLCSARLPWQMNHYYLMYALLYSLYLLWLYSYNLDLEQKFTYLFCSCSVILQLKSPSSYEMAAGYECFLYFVENLSCSYCGSHSSLDHLLLSQMIGESRCCQGSKCDMKSAKLPVDHCCFRFQTVSCLSNESFLTRFNTSQSSFELDLITMRCLCRVAIIGFDKYFDFYFVI